MDVDRAVELDTQRLYREHTEKPAPEADPDEEYERFRDMLDRARFEDNQFDQHDEECLKRGTEHV